MEIDDNGLEVLDEATCRRLLASTTIGRIGLCSAALPTVLPVSFVLTDEGIVFRTGRGAKLEAATHGAVLAFEVDEIDAFSHAGWSVVVTGVARQVTDPDELVQVRSLPLAHWGVARRRPLRPHLDRHPERPAHRPARRPGPHGRRWLAGAPPPELSDLAVSLRRAGPAR